MNIEDVKKKMSFIGGQYLDSAGLPISPESVEVTITKLAKSPVLNTRTMKEDEKWILHIEELPEFPIVLGAKTNRKFLMAKLGALPWTGKKVKICNDTSVKAFGRVGAVRFTL